MYKFQDLLEAHDGVEEVLNKIDKAVADADHHRMVGVAGKIWANIEEYIDEDKRLEVAIKISSSIFDQI